MDEGTEILPGLPAVAGKPVHVAFDGGRLTSNAGDDASLEHIEWPPRTLGY